MKKIKQNALALQLTLGNELADHGSYYA